MKHFLVSGCLFFIMTSTFAQQMSLVVWENDGSKMYYDLSEKPKTFFSDEKLYISTIDMEIEYPLEKVVKYTYETSTTALDNVKKDEIRIGQIAETLNIYNISSENNVKVYSFDGLEVITDNFKKSDGILTIPLLHNKGYIIKIDDKSFKILKK